MFLRQLCIPGALAALILGACSDDNGQPPQPDSGVDATVDGPVPDASPYLAPGQFRDFVASGGTVEGTLPTQGNEKLLFLLISRDTTPLKAYPYTVASVTATSGTLSAPAPRPRRADQQLPPCRFMSELQKIIDSGPRRLWRPKQFLAASQPPKVGDQRSINVGGKLITAEAVLVDDVAAYWVDKTTQPLATVDPQVLKELADGFGKVVVPRERIYFGHESDLDGDGHISVIFSPLVASQAIAYVSPCDLVDPVAVPACKNGNQMELVYSSPPDQLPSYMAGASALLELFAHELQHAIYFHRKYNLNGISILKDENAYLTEGLSDLAADLSGYNAGLIHRIKAGLDGIDSLSVPNLTSDAVSSYVPGDDDGIMRGGVDVLVRYLYDQAGGDTLDPSGVPQDKGGIKWLRSFVDSKELGQANVTTSTKLTIEQLIEQFWTALALSNRGPDHGPLNPDPRYNFLPVAPDPVTGNNRGLNLFGTVKSTSLLGPKIQSFDNPDGSLRAGGAEMLQLVVKSTLLRFVFKTTAEARPLVRVIRLM